MHRGTLLAPKILRWLLDFWKIYGPLTNTSVTRVPFVEHIDTALFYVTLLSFARQLTSKALHLFRRAVSEVAAVLFPIHFFGGWGLLARNVA